MTTKLVSTGITFPEATTQTTEATTVANAALPKTGGTMTGAITTNSTFDGVDVATRDGVLTTTTTTAGAALPKAGGTMTGTIAGFTSTGIDDNATSTAITIDASENVGIGTTAPTGQVHVKGGNASNLIVDNGGEQYTQILLSQGSASNSGGDILIDGTANTMDIRSLQVGDMSLKTCVSAGATIERLKIASAGDVTVSTGNLVIGTAGKGIDFSATSVSGTSELLDDYEEGNWTPTVISTGWVGTTSINSAHYQKIGNRVFFQCYITANITTAGSAVQIGGLPYTSRGGSSYTPFLHTHGTLFHSRGGYISSGNTQMSAIANNSAGTAAMSGTGTRYSMLSGSYAV